MTAPAAGLTHLTYGQAVDLYHRLTTAATAATPDGGPARRGLEVALHCHQPTKLDPQDDAPMGFCGGCWDEGKDRPVAYPCPEVHYLAGALGVPAVPADPTPPPEVTRRWTEGWDEFVRQAYASARLPLDLAAERKALAGQLPELTWREPNGMMPFSPGHALKALTSGMGNLTGRLVRVSYSGVVHLPDGSERMTLTLLGAEYAYTNALLRVYAVDAGTRLVVALIEEVPVAAG